MSDSRMTLYEELGLSVSAAPEDIRRAHRTLSRLLHPDQQTDDALRQAAELQMRRVNVIIDILLDPQKRRRYDVSLRATPPDTAPPYPVTPRIVVRAAFSWLDLVGIILSAVLVTLLMIWLFGGDFIHLRGSELHASVDAAALGPREEFSRSSPETVRRSPVREKDRTERVPDTEPVQALEIHTMRLPGPVELAPQRRLAAPILAFQPDPLTLSSSAYPLSSIIVPAPPVPEIAIPPDKPTPPALSFTGLWLLPSSGRKAGGSGPVRQAPQYIQISILRGQNDTVYGEYSARYEAPDRPISPEVAFIFQGPVAGKEVTFDWNAMDGSRGAVELKLLNRRSMQVAWHVTEFGTSIGIAGGAAVVIRKAD